MDAPALADVLATSSAGTNVSGLVHFHAFQTMSKRAAISTVL
jgi:hypothetical protein